MLDVGAAEVLGGDDGGADDLDGLSAGGVTAGHFVVHLAHGTAEGGGTVLLVHVDGDGSGEVPENDAVVLDAVGVLLKDLTGVDDFALNLSNLVLSLHVVPELGTSKNGVTSKDAHSVELGLGGLLTGEGSADNVELSDLQIRCGLGRRDLPSSD